MHCPTGILVSLLLNLVEYIRNYTIPPEKEDYDLPVDDMEGIEGAEAGQKHVALDLSGRRWKLSPATDQMSKALGPSRRVLHRRKTLHADTLGVKGRLDGPMAPASRRDVLTARSRKLSKMA